MKMLPTRKNPAPGHRRYCRICDVLIPTGETAYFMARSTGHGSDQQRQWWLCAEHYTRLETAMQLAVAT